MICLIELVITCSIFFVAIGKANIGFLIDGSIVKHIAMIQRWIYNLILLFARGSYVSVGSYGGTVTLVSVYFTEHIKLKK